MESQTLRCFLIPFRGGQAILPNSSMVEVLPFATPLKMENTPSWVIGMILWRAVNVPLVSLERLIEEQTTMPAYSRIVMINSLSKDPQLPHIGLLGTDAPRLLRLERPQLGFSQSKDKPVKPGILGWATLDGEDTCIPDLDALDENLAPLMRQHG